MGDKVSSFCDRLRQAIGLRGITQSELSIRSGVSPSSISHYLSGDWEGKSDAAHALANALGVSDLWLMGYDVPIDRLNAPQRAATRNTYREKVSWLRRYRDSLRRQRELEQEVDMLRSTACRVTPLLSPVPGGSGDGNALPRSVENIMRAQEELENQILLCESIRRDVTCAIEKIESQRDQEIMRRRYILGQRWECISYEMHLEYRWVTRRHRKIVENGVEVLTPESPT